MSELKLPSPDRLLACVMSYRLSAALKTAIEIDLFTAIGEGRVTPEALAARCKVDARAVRILSDFLVTCRFLSKQEESYELTDESRTYLDRRSPHYNGAANGFALQPVLWEQFGRLTDIVREGGARSQALALAPNHAMWLRFARDMADEMAASARIAVPIIRDKVRPGVQRPLKVLDVAAGHGMFGITFAQEEPSCHVVAQDWPQILAVTWEHAVKHGVADRFALVPGDILQAEIGTGYDVVLIPNLIHYMSPSSITQLFRKVRAAMKPGGVLAVVEYAPNDDRVWPPFAQFALFSLVTSPEGDAYTVNEILRMCWEVGFSDLEYRDVGWQRLMLATNKSAPPAGLVVSGAIPRGGTLSRAMPQINSKILRIP